MFARNLYRYGLLGPLHRSPARGRESFTARDCRTFLAARDVAEQRVLFERTIAPLFRQQVVRFLSRIAGVLLPAVGIPPANTTNWWLPRPTAIR